MIIAIKIKKEDKRIMELHIASMPERKVNCIEDLFLSETMHEIYIKLLITGNTAKPIRLNTPQLIVFNKYLELYAKLGIYEESNAGILRQQIITKIKEKI